MYSKNIVFRLCIAVVLAAFSIACLSWRGEEIEQWEVPQKGFKIRIVAYDEKGGVPLSGRYYVLNSALLGKEEWHEIMSVFTKDLIPIPKENFRVVDGKVAYFFMKHKFAVTTDAGNSWSVWDANKEYDNYAYIKDVQIELKGAGKMNFHNVPSQQRELPDLYTNDYGRHWESN